MEVIVQVVAALGAGGGLFWFILSKAVDAQLKKMEAQLQREKTDHEADRKLLQSDHDAQLKGIQAQLDASLEVSNHAKNTVFSRYDEKRADAILKLQGALNRFSWQVLKLGMPVIGRGSVSDHFAVRLIELTVLADSVLENSGDNSFFFPKELRGYLVQQWYPTAREIISIAAHVGKSLDGQPEFQAKGALEQSVMIRTEFESQAKEASSRIFEMQNVISDVLEKMFRDSTPLPTSDESATSRTTPTPP